MGYCSTPTSANGLTLVEDAFDRLEVVEVSSDQGPLGVIGDSFSVLRLIQISPSPARSFSPTPGALDNYHLDETHLDGDGL